jgi:hypothetical protein
MGATRVSFGAAEALTNLDTMLAFPLEQYFHVWLLLTLSVIVLAVVSLRGRSEKISGEAGAEDLPLFAGALLLLAPAGFCWFLWQAKVQTQPWHFLPLAAVLATCLDLGLPLWRRRWHASALGFVVATALVAAPFARRDLDWRFTNADLLAKSVTEKSAPGDYVIVVPWFSGITFERYYAGRAAWDTLPPIADHTLHYFHLVAEFERTPHAMQPVFEKISAALRAGHRVWFVSWMGLPAPGEPMPESLPPPPLKFTGWSDMPYNLKWTAQCGNFLVSHGVNVRQVVLANRQPVNTEETLQLFVIEGWRD